ncbi:MAG: ring finger domain protein [Hyperionvirus sp.]|uniref:RING-type E3 ubiquitin transferase n=1 Tax=Hyperionvirus sp. TaxID=2487770 RepID=A0A3G5AA64_9VIRU|nr:MAG: ring finger domain protein [Hyperionvirus sp.]
MGDAPNDVDPLLPIVIPAVPRTAAIKFIAPIGIFIGVMWIYFWHKLESNCNITATLSDMMLYSFVLYLILYMFNKLLFNKMFTRAIYSMGAFVPAIIISATVYVMEGKGNNVRCNLFNSLLAMCSYSVAIYVIALWILIRVYRNSYQIDLMEERHNIDPIPEVVPREMIIANQIYIYPFCSHNKTSGTERARVNDTHENCVICLADYVIGERVIELPCDHVYHFECYREWMKQKNACPTCRNSFVSGIV